MATKFDNYTDDINHDNFGGAVYCAQTFTPSLAYLITFVKTRLLKNVSGADGTMTLAIRATAADEPTGGNLASGTLPGTDLLLNTPTWHEFTLGTAFLVTPGTKYAIVHYKTGTYSAQWRRGLGTYAGGWLYKSNDSGSSWYKDEPTLDWAFEVWGDLVAGGGGGGPASLLIAQGQI